MGCENEPVKTIMFQGSHLVLQNSENLKHYHQALLYWNCYRSPIRDNKHNFHIEILIVKCVPWLFLIYPSEYN